jgi:hypothetical protein
VPNEGAAVLSVPAGLLFAVPDEENGGNADDDDECFHVGS